jgi:DNA-binding MarR family transcriptional regulator
MTTQDTRAAEGDIDPVRVWIRFLRLHQRLTGIAGNWLKGIGLSIAQFDALTVLDAYRGITQQMLAGQLYVTKGNVSGLIDRLVEAGLVERRAIPGDRRSHALFITPAGEEKVAKGLAAQDAFVRGTLGRMAPGEVATLGRLLAQWRDIARAGQEESLPPRER